MDNIDINKLWQNFVDTFTNHYNDMNGRMGRSQFWYYILVYVVVGVGVAIVGGILRIGPLVQAAYYLALFLPNVGMTARRLQDTGKSGSLAWLLAVPLVSMLLSALLVIGALLTFGLFALLFAPVLMLVGLASLVCAVYLIYLCAQPGEASANAYGPPPAPWTPGGKAAPPAAPAT